MPDANPTRIPALARGAARLVLGLGAAALMAAGIATTAESDAHMYVAASCFAGAFAASVAGVVVRGPRRPESRGFKLAAGSVVLVFLAALGVWSVFVHEEPGCEFIVEDDAFDPEVSWGRWEGRDCTEEQREPEMYID